MTCGSSGVAGVPVKRVLVGPDRLTSSSPSSVASSKAWERSSAGVRRTAGASRPLLSLFRWVFPYGHQAGQPCGSPAANASCAESRTSLPISAGSRKAGAPAFDDTVASPASTLSNQLTAKHGPRRRTELRDRGLAPLAPKPSTMPSPTHSASSVVRTGRRSAPAEPARPSRFVDHHLPGESSRSNTDESGTDTSCLLNGHTPAQPVSVDCSPARRALRAGESGFEMRGGRGRSGQVMPPA